ncbi:MAG: type II secretion system protein M [Hyphomonadaceae bacterium]|nr:type II secretion system protein M [Hyphomonadaceae bacterium]
MSAWWSGLETRERLLIAIAATLTLLVVIWQFVLVPSVNARAEARANLEEADRDLSRIQESYMLKRAIGAASPTNARPTSASIEDFKAAVTGSASDIGLSISRLQGDDSASVRLVFENADPRLVFLWLEDIQAKHGGQVSRFNMEQAGGGMVRVNVDLVAGGL